MKQLLYIGNKLSKKGKTVTSIETLGKMLKSEGYSVKTASNKSNKVFRLLDMLFHVAKYNRKTDYVLIDTYSTTNFYYSYLVSQLCRLFNLKYIPILRGGNLPERLSKSPNLSKTIFNNAYKNIAPSEYIKSNFESLSYKNIICIPNTIELKNYHFSERKINEVKLLWVRSFSRLYNPFLAVKILKVLKDQSIKSTLCMVGPDNDGSMQETKMLAQELNVEVTITGKLSKHQWIDLAKDYNVFINTTNFDNTPISVIEAMALGLPIISTNVGGMPFLIENEKDGVLLEPNNVEAFVNAIKDLISQPEKAKQLTKNARKKIEQYDWETVKYKWFEVLQ